MDSTLLKSFLVEIFLLISLLIMLVYNSYLATSSRYNFPLIDKDSFVQTMGILGICFCILLNTDFGSIDSGRLFCNDVAAIHVKLVVVLAIICSLIIGQNYFVYSKINLFEFFSANLLVTFSLLVLSSSTDLISVYLALEMQSLSFYILASFNRYSAFSTEAGLKYFVLGAFVSGLFLFGSALLYGISGTTNFFSYSLLFSKGFTYELKHTILFLGIFFILVTFLFKISAAPFHVWSPDVYEGAPLNSTIVFVLVPKIVIFLLVFRVLYFSFPSYLIDFKNVFLITGGLSVLVGSLMAFRQKRLKRLLIYSSISHVGFLLLGCSTSSLLGLTAVIYYIIFYIITNILIWGILSILHSYTRSPVYISDLASLYKTNPALAITLCLGLFSLAGVPPMVGFSMKFFIFSSAISAGLYVISFLIILFSIIGSFYYLRVIKIMYFEYRALKDFLTCSSQQYSEVVYILISFCFSLVLFSFFNPNIFLLVSYKISLGLGYF